ncbi:MAG: carboxypeptidase regulatory-like domain-containing protein, partial [Lentisphaeria bacterium]|nr:carboxypeptidase regulatory-like domain-containing protein [Lentisphaeria bacterium]
SVRTDSNGNYSFTALPPGRYDLAAAADGHGASARQTTRLTSYDDGKTVDLTLSGAASLTGTVVQADGGAPVEGASISINAYPPAPSFSGAISDATGSFVINDLAPGTYDVFATVAGYDMARNSVTLPGGSVVVELSKWGRIYGTVSRGSDLVSGIDVTVLSKSKELEWTATTDNDGNYSVDILHTGVYAVAIGSSSGLSLASKEVTVSAAQNSVACNFDLDISVVSGMVYQPDGVTPMSNAVVSLAFQNEAVGRQTTDDGSYSFLVHTPGIFTVTAMGADGLAPPLTNIVVGTNVVVDGQNLTVGSNTVYCTVTDTVGTPIEDAVVYLSSLADSTSNSLYLVYRTEANGTCTFNGMADGVYMARVSGAGYALAEHEITLPGSGLETFAMEAGRVIEGQVTSAESGGAPVSDVLVSVGNLRFGEVAVVLTDADG